MDLVASDQILQCLPVHLHESIRQPSWSRCSWWCFAAETAAELLASPALKHADIGAHRQMHAPRGNKKAYYSP